MRGIARPSIDGFAYGTVVTISPATPVADYEIRLNLDSSFNYSACQADGDDVRFFDNADAPLSFWIEKWTSGGDSILWVKVPLAGTTSIKMAYGNATIGSGSDGEATFPLFDDFSGATVNATKWDIRNDTYSNASVVAGKAHVRSHAPLSVVPYVWMGFADFTWSVAYGTDVSNAVMRVSDDLQSEESTTITKTTVKKNQTWVLMDYANIDGSNAKYYENETLLAYHTTNVPSTALPVSFAARSLQYGPGTNYAAFIRSKVTFAPGYAVRAQVWFQHDFQYTPTSLESIVDVDWVFARKCSAIESIANIGTSNDTSPPSIVVSGFAASSIEQGDVAYLTWTLTDAHPTIYILYLNGDVIRFGSYASGSQVSVQIDSSTIGQLNYTMVAHDAFGNVQCNVTLISVVNRTDGGIFLYVGLNIINHNDTHQLILTLNMSNWAVLYLNVAISVTTTSSLLPGPLPSGLVIALPVAFNLSITNSSALRSGSIRIYYSQTAIANQVNENDMIPLRWNAGTSSWVPTVSGLSRSANYVDIPLSENGLYIIASTPKQNYYPILIIVLIGISGGIVAVAGYGYARKKSLKQKVTGKVIGKGKSITTYSAGIPSGPVEQSVNESLAKRARLMQVTTPSTNSRPSAAALFGTVEQQTGPTEAVKKKAGASTEPDIDIAARAAHAQEMASEVSLERVGTRCVVHKGPISGLSYTCKQCGTVYCMKCAKHLSETGEVCWTCNSPLSLSDEDESENSLPKITVSIFSAEVWQRIRELDIPEEIFDEVIEYLKGLPPSSRLKYLEETFKDNESFDAEF